MNAKRLIACMKGLIKDAKRKVILILDNLRVHHARLVKEWVAEHAESIEICYLPAYSPELNPEVSQLRFETRGAHGIARPEQTGSEEQNEGAYAETPENSSPRPQVL